MYENHNDYTFIIVMCCRFALSVPASGARVARETAAAALVAGCIVGVMLSLSRGGILALVLEGALSSA